MMAGLNLWIALGVFFISLPVAVVSGAALLGLRDTDALAPGMLRLAVCAAVLLSLLLIFGSAYHLPMLAAFALVITLHLMAYWGLRRWVNANNKP